MATEQTPLTDEDCVIQLKAQKNSWLEDLEFGNTHLVFKSKLFGGCIAFWFTEASVSTSASSDLDKSM